MNSPQQHVTSKRTGVPGVARIGRKATMLLATIALMGASVAVLIGAEPSGATVVAAGGAIQIVSAPATVPIDSARGNLISIFNERTAYTLPSAIPVDAAPSNPFASATYTGASNLTPSTISAGTPIDSYFIYDKPLGQPGTGYAYDASMTFSTPILGLIFTTGSLVTTDLVVGAPTTTYKEIEYTGLEKRDSVEFATPYKLNVKFHTGDFIDCVRVITAASPTTSPGTTGGSGPGGQGYTEVASDGGIFNFDTPFEGSMGGQPLNAPIVGGAQDTGSLGYWEVASDGGIFSFGGAPFYGSLGSTKLNSPIVGMASTPDGLGYWLVGADGGVFSYGDAAFYGSMGGLHINAPIVGIASTPDGLGYWLVGADGGIYTFGDGQFYGSAGSLRLNKPIVGIAVATDGVGYWLVASDGGIFSYGADGSLPFYGSMGGKPLNQPMVGIIPTPDGLGYWTIASDGGVFSFGDAHFLGSMGGTVLNKPVNGGW